MSRLTTTRRDEGDGDEPGRENIAISGPERGQGMWKRRYPAKIITAKNGTSNKTSPVGSGI
ncbi:hypothetical protein B30_07511 [Celeribacter baekdonensis B30]|uniref:Uncharacterized protein n=1 Tax=Celeribacter baekdonensis B30 TaxID=1208323 RepID=K2JDQ7_9RHOB|nr:hypothetical protein B30_07511 [Celeribacter baekdonensis B30]KAB6717933.1 hypothetical protein C8029_01980 [Roseobacter sp. TSBP12]|tara:strand:- start:15570 stop:15752 length:183 start_codon:yes stop_codon:yes gene_type:complete